VGLTKDGTIEVPTSYAEGAGYLDQPTDLPDGCHKSSALDPEGV